MREKLLKLQDKEYKNFTQKLIPTVENERIIGIRTPVLKKLAKEIKKEEAAEFLRSLPHFYLEENNLHSFIIMNIKNFDECIKEINLFLPYVDNWATCDSLRPKSFAKNKKELLHHIDLWISSAHSYTVRFGIQMLMVHFLDDDFDVKYAHSVASVQSDEYYVNMMKAWYFATALAKQYESIFPFISNYRLDKWTHNKSIQKSIESYRLTNEQKDLLKAYRIK